MKSPSIVIMGILIAGSIGVFSFDNVFAQSLDLPIITQFTTDKTSYTFGETIVISGNIERNDFLHETFQIHMYHPNGNTLLEFDLSDDSNGDFTNTITAGGIGWTEEGTYRIYVIYHVDGITAETSSFKYTNLIQNEKKLDTISKQLEPQTQSEVKSLDVKISREQSQYDEYYKLYQYYEEKLSQEEDPKLSSTIHKLDSLKEKINSLIDKRNMLVSQSGDAEMGSNLIKQIEEKPQKQLFCFLFWCW